ncbi:MAG: hypothetical protein Q7R70_00270 [Candidatus Diapherotrites archaeon]|nr:hypothetical protein [Candidatus Diapherotrites archaeon]
MRLVEKEVSQRPFIQYALGQELINCAALAKQFQPSIERELGRKVKNSAVIMALHRLSEEFKLKEHRLKCDFGSELNLKNNLVEFTFERTSTILKKLQKLYEEVDYGKGHYFNVLQGSFELSIIINQTLEKKLREIMKGERLLNFEKCLSAVTMTVSKDFAETPGVIFTTTRQLAWNNINIFEFLSTMTEISFIVSEKDSVNAYACLKELLSKNKVYSKVQ